MRIDISEDEEEISTSNRFEILPVDVEVPEIYLEQGGSSKNIHLTVKRKHSLTEEARPSKKKKVSEKSKLNLKDV